MKPCGDAALQISLLSPRSPPGSICQDRSSSERRQWVRPGRITRLIDPRCGDQRVSAVTALRQSTENANLPLPAAALEYSGLSPPRFAFIPPPSAPFLLLPPASLAFSKGDCHRLSSGPVKGTGQDTEAQRIFMYLDNGGLKAPSQSEVI